MKKFFTVAAVVLSLLTSCEPMEGYGQCGTATDSETILGPVNSFGEREIMYYIWIDGNRHTVDFNSYINTVIGEEICVHY